MAKLENILKLVKLEFMGASASFPKFNSAHEGYAVLLEEVDELWEEVKKKEKDEDAMFVEAKQVAAMALRFLYDICGETIEGMFARWLDAHEVLDRRMAEFKEHGYEF